MGIRERTRECSDRKEKTTFSRTFSSEETYTEQQELTRFLREGGLASHLQQVPLGGHQSVSAQALLGSISVNVCLSKQCQVRFGFVTSFFPLLLGGRFKFSNIEILAEVGPHYGFVVLRF